MRYFRGTIADKKLSDFNKYDNSLERYEDRKNFVNSFLYDGESVHDFFSVYFSEYYAVSPNQKGFLAEDDSVCKLLEILGTYILNANDVESNRKIKYKFWKSEREYRDYKESKNISMTTVSEDNDVIEVIDMFIDKKNDKNQKIVKGAEVLKKDINEIEEIKLIQGAIDYLKSPNGMKSIREFAVNLIESDNCNEEEKEKLKYIANNTKRYIDKYTKELKENQLAIKESIKRPIVFRNALKDEGAPNKLDAFDFMEDNDIKSLLPYLSHNDLMTDFGIIVYDLIKLLEESNLSPRELDIVRMYKEGMRQSEIADELGINKSTVRKMEYRISKKAVKAYENKVENYRRLKRLKKIWEMLSPFYPLKSLLLLDRVRQNYCNLI